MSEDGARICRQSQNSSPGEEQLARTNQFAVVNTLERSDVAGFFVCCAAVKHRRTAVHLSTEVLSSTKFPSRSRSTSASVFNRLTSLLGRMTAGSGTSTFRW